MQTLALTVVMLTSQAPDLLREEGHRSLREQAERGDIESQALLGDIQDNGEGVPEDDAEALTWLRMAREQGLSREQYDFALR